MSASRFITEFWLREVGFKPHWFANQPNQHWLLWLGDDLGIELSFGRETPEPWWFCWVRTGSEHTAEKFIHIRYLSLKHEVITLVQALTGRHWDSRKHINGSVQVPTFFAKRKR